MVLPESLHVARVQATQAKSPVPIVVGQPDQAVSDLLVLAWRLALGPIPKTGFTKAERSISRPTLHT